MKGLLPTDSIWRFAYERTLIFVTSLGGFLMGLGLLAVSPAGFDGIDIVAWGALGVGIAAASGLILNKTTPVPFLILLAVLVGAASVFVDSTTAMALAGILVSVLATGSLLINRRRGLLFFAVLTVMAVVIRPALAALDALPAMQAEVPSAAAWLVVGTTLIMTAIGFRALRDQLMRRDEHNADLTDLISSLARHIRTPLTATIGFAYLLRSELGDDPAGDYADGVIRRGWEVSQGLDDLIVAAQSDATSLEMVKRGINLRVAVNETLDRVHGSRVKLRVMDVSGRVIGDPQRVQHILRHLITNAVIHGGSRLTIHSRIVGRKIEVHISDDGRPLSAQERALVFQPFYRNPSSEHLLGRGIGLTVCRILARAMSGDVRFDSDHTGNTAVLSLPIDPAVPEASVAGRRLGSRVSAAEPTEA